MDLKDNCGHHPQTPAVDFKLREGRETAFIKRGTAGTELLPPHHVALLRGKQGHPPDESGSQNMAPQEGPAFGNTGTEPSTGQKEACPHIFLLGQPECTRASGKRGGVAARRGEATETREYYKDHRGIASPRTNHWHSHCKHRPKLEGAVVHF